MSLAQELPFATINQAALDPEIVSASERELKLERKLSAVMNRMEEDKIVHSMEVLSVLDRVTKVREQLSKCEQEKASINQEYVNIKARLEETSAETQSLKSGCSKLKEQINSIRADNSISVTSVSKIEGELEKLRKEFNDAKEQLSKIQEANKSLNDECEEHKRDFSELWCDNNFHVMQHNAILDELETLKKQNNLSLNSCWETESKQLQKKMAQLQDERNYFEERYETYVAEYQRCVERRIEMEAEIKRLKRQRNQYQKRNYV